MADNFKLNTAGVAEMLKSQEMKDVCSQYAYQVAGSLGKDYDIVVDVGNSRARATIMTATDKAVKDNYDNNTLLKAVDS